MAQRNNRENAAEPSSAQTEHAEQDVHPAPYPGRGWHIIDRLRKAVSNAKADRITAWATVVLAAITIVLAIIALWGLRNTEIATRRSDRAYVFAEPANAYNVKAGGSPLQVYIMIANSGKTFGRIMERRIGASILEPPTPDKIEDLGRMPSEPGKPVVWPRQQHYVIRTLGQLGEEDFRQITTEKGEKRVYVFGRIRYEDVFGSTHETTFCHMYFGPEMTNLPPYGVQGYNSTQAKYCEKHNDAD